MNIRHAELSDVDAIAQVHVMGWQHAYAEILPADFLQALSIERRAEMWREAVTRQTPQLLVAEVEGQIAGFCAFGLCRDAGALPADFELWAIYLKPVFLGTGIGLALWLQSFAAMKLAGATDVALWVVENNERAIHFYKKAGFIEEIGARKSIQVGGIAIDEIRYAQSIAA